MLQAELAQVETPGSERKWVSRAHLPESCAQGANVRRENTEQNGWRISYRDPLWRTDTEVGARTVLSRKGAS